MFKKNLFLIMLSIALLAITQTQAQSKLNKPHSTTTGQNGDPGKNGKRHTDGQRGGDGTNGKNGGNGGNGG